MDRRPAAIDRLDLWFSTGRSIDGLWVGTTESEPQPGLRRVEEAFQLIKIRDPLHYSRVIKNLERIWVRLLPGIRAHYERSLKACVFDERFVLLEATTIERIASTIVHETTHARLEGWGIGYDDEKKRARIEAICIRRELNFVGKLPQSEALQGQLARTLEWCVSDHDHYSDASFQQRKLQGEVDTLRHLGAPEWLIGFVLKTHVVIGALRRLVRRPTGRSRQTTNIPNG